MSKLLAVLVLVLVGCASVPPPKVAVRQTQPDIQLILEGLGVVPESTGQLTRYDTLEEAAVKAIERAYRCSRNYECGGSIAKDPNGKFVVGPVDTDYEGDSVGIPRFEPTGWTAVAMYHTHPCIPDHATGLFSPQDMAGATMKRVLAFMGDLCTGDVHEYDPKTMRADTTAYSGIYLTGGKIVGHITLTPPIKQDADTGA